jgi:hypothetical protein
VAEGKHLLFVTKPSGYELVERDGDVPELGAEIEVGEEGTRFTVAKIGPSPLPQDDRQCAYLQGVS